MNDHCLKALSKSSTTGWEARCTCGHAAQISVRSDASILELETAARTSIRHHSEEAREGGPNR